MSSSIISGPLAPEEISPRDQELESLEDAVLDAVIGDAHMQVFAERLNNELIRACSDKILKSRLKAGAKAIANFDHGKLLELDSWTWEYRRDTLKLDRIVALIASYMYEACHLTGAGRTSAVYHTLRCIRAHGNSAHITYPRTDVILLIL